MPRKMLMLREMVACALLLAALVLGGCPAREQARPATAGTSGDARRASASAPDSQRTVEVDAGPRAEDDVCGQLQARFRARLEEGGGCARDDECACYPSALDCGGVSDQRTVAQLITLARMYRLARCPAPRGCTPAACRPACMHGRCVQSASASATAAIEPRGESPDCLRRCR